MPTVPPHLTTGSQRPPLVEGKLRLYSMEYCPYAQRARLVLLAKKIPHDIVNINLINKPEWYFDVNPKGLVPALDTGSEVIVESLDVANWLDEKYPENPLYPSDVVLKERDKELINKVGDLSGAFGRNVFSLEKKNPEDVANDLRPHLDIFEKELSSRGGVFFGGDKASMVDYMLWPWGERAGTLTLALEAKVPFGDDEFPLLRRWRKAMRENPVCDQIYHGSEIFWKVVQFKLKNLKPDYDNL